MARARPAFERERKFLARAPGKKIQLETLCPLLNLPRRDHQLFVSHVSGSTIAAPIKSFERRARFFVRSRVPERTHPSGNHSPIVVETGFALPVVQLGIGDTLAGNVAYRLQSGTPIRAAHVHQYTIHVEDQDLRL